MYFILFLNPVTRTVPVHRMEARRSVKWRLGTYNNTIDDSKSEIKNMNSVLKNSLSTWYS